MSGPVSERISGRTLGEFVVREQIGAGGFGAVYRAQQPLLGREAVIKVLHARLSASDEGVQRFLREVRLAARLDHPFAAHIYAFGAEPDGLRWIAMEMVHGTPLDQLLEANGPLPLDRLVGLLERICEVLHTAHEQGIIHRDIKPANVMVLSRAGRLLPKLLDFGIAKLVDEGGYTGATVGRSPARVEPPVLDETAGGEGDRGGLGAPQGAALAETLADPGSPSVPSGGRITQEGAAVGSPLYMAPEQWIASAAVSTRSDIYSLGCLAYEALTGAPPFPGRTLAAIAAGHAKGAIPPLGDGLPQALDGVLRRALAKRPAERFATALEMAVAFRAASGMSAERESLPQLPDELRARVLAEAPPPIAEAVLALDGAGNAHQAREAVGAAAHAAARYLGLLALACRTHVGRDGSEPPAVVEALRHLRKEGLSDEQWTDLARQLSRPFAHRREAYPLPELVALFWTRGGERRDDPLSRLLGQRAAGLRVSGGQAEQVHDQLGRLVSSLRELLEALSFLDDYPLAVPRGERAERWMGARRPQRPTVPLSGPTLAAGQPVILSRDGAAVLELSPLVAIARPAPGTPHELFLLEGPGRRGAKLVALPAGFERHDPDLWEWFGDALLDLSAADRGASGDERAPYCGLSAFTVDDAANFFGREREAEAFANRLRVQALLAVVGPSGAGKSSFVNAGVLPLLPRDWHTIAVRPGPAPLAQLAARLAQEGLHPDLTRAEALGEALRAHATERGQTLVLVVDQLEELITLCHDDRERAAYARAIAEAARAPEDPVRVVVTLRDDFLIRCEELPGLSELLGIGLQLLHTPAPEALLGILVEPARRARYDFEDPQLPEEMVREVAGLPGALALLSFTAARLWELRDRQFRQLSRRAYAAMGGVGGALARHAEDTLSSLPAGEQRLVREAFRNLVTSEGTRATVGRADLLRMLGGAAQAESVVEKLIAARLLVSSEGDGSEERVEVVHEALLAAWPRLNGWVREDREGARLRDQLREAARQWHERGRPSGLLWRGDALAEYERWRRSNQGPLGEAQESFARASLLEAQRGRRWRRGLLAAAFLVLAGSVVSLSTLYRRSEAASRQAGARILELYEEQGRQLLLSGDPLRALPYLDAAYAGGRDGPGMRLMLGHATAALAPQVAVLEGESHELWWAAVSPDGARAVTADADHQARVWDLASGRTLRTLSGHQGAVEYAEFSSDGRSLVTASVDGTARIWDAESGAPRATLRHRDEVWSARFSPDGQRIATLSADGTTRLWDAASGAPLAALPGRTSEGVNALRMPFAVAFSRDGRRLAAAVDGKQALMWDASDGRLLARFGGHLGAVRALGFSPDGARLVTAGGRGAKLWRADGAAIAALDEHTAPILFAGFSPDGRRIVTTSDDQTARLWDGLTGAPLARLEGHRGKVLSALWSDGGARLTTASADGTLRVWRAETGALLATLVGHRSYVRAIALMPDGRRILSASADGTARLWDLERIERTVPLAGHPGTFVSSAGFTADGTRVVSTGAGEALREWDASDGRLLATLVPDRGRLQTADWSPDGRVLVAGTTDGASVWQLGEAAPKVRLRGQSGDVLSARFSSDGARVVTGGVDRTARLWDARSGALLRTISGHTDEVGDARFSPDGGRVVTASSDKSARVWSAADGALLVTLSGHTLGVYSATFSPDGHTVATASADKTARLWDAGTGRLLSTFEGHGRELGTVEFSADGALLVTSSLDGSARIWEVATGRELLALHGHAQTVAATLSPDGGRLVTGGSDGSLLVWQLGREQRGAKELAHLVRCRVPFELVEGRLFPREPDRRECAPGAP